MISIKNIFNKIKSKKFITKISTTDSLEINPKEITSFSKNYFLLSNSTELKSIGIILSSGIPLSTLNNKNFTITNLTDNSISYALSSGLQIKKHTLLNPKLITNAIYSLKKLNSTILAWKINRILKKLFLANITSKHLESIYYAILNSSHRKNAFCFYNHSSSQNLKHKHIKLVSKTTPLNSYKNLKFINSFQSLRIHTSNLLFYKNSNNKLYSNIATLIESFFLDNKSNKNLHTLKSYINLHLKQLGINYKLTNRTQKQLFSHILLQ
ncbi:PF-88 family protein (plasmid) [Borrelia hermsii]|uniref:hypothetical protein n=1 Tax=Borrelia hermsii TaxID=140 RepID=UPI0021AE10BF|nr:hypothetical protein [Borrelia hermsii]UVY98919.1 PF-88 family protein [Borrelia hermsii]